MRLQVPVHAAPNTDYFNGREPVKRQPIDVLAGEFADVRLGRRHQGAGCESEGHENDDGKTSAHTRKLTPPLISGEPTEHVRDASASPSNPPVNLPMLVEHPMDHQGLREW